MRGDRLRKLRENKKMYQEDLAKKLNVSKSAIGMYERDEREPNDETLIKMATFFSCTTDYLLGHSDDPDLTAKEDKEITKQEKVLMAKIDSLPKEERERIINKILAYVDVETNASEE